MTLPRLSALALLGAACAWNALPTARADSYNSGGPVPRKYVGFGLYPGYFPGFYSNGFSMYGPPVPTYAPVPGVYGGSSQRFYDFYPGYGLTVPLNHWSAKGGYYVWPPKPLPTGLPPMFHPAPKLVFPEPVATDSPLPPPGPGPDHGPVLPTEPTPEQGPPPRPLDIEPVSAPAARPEAAAVLIEVNLPNGDAVVQFDGKAAPGNGTTRQFESPPLPSGPTFRYDIVVRWQEDGKDVFHGRTVPVRAGQRVVVDFTKPGELALEP